MEVRELRTIVALAEHLHFGRAAEAVHLSQPALSKQLRKMENEVGGALLLRRGSRTQLTPAGHSLVEDARRVLAEMAAMVHRASRVAQGQEGRLRIGFGLATRHLLPAVVASFRERCPRILVTLADMSTAAQFKLLVAGELDIGFARLPAPAGLRSLNVCEERLVLASPSGARGAGRSGWKQVLGDFPRVALLTERAPHYADQVKRLLARHDVHTEPVQGVADFETLMTLVSAGIGYAIVPRSAVGAHGELLEIHALPGSEARWNIGAVWIQGPPGSAVDEFVRCLRQSIASARPAR